MKAIWKIFGIALGMLAATQGLKAQTTNSATGGSPSGGSTNAAPASASALMGTVSFATQPSSEVTTLGYELTSDEANRIAHTVYHSLMNGNYHTPEPGQAAAESATPDVGPQSRPTPRQSQEIDVLIVNQKRSALLTVQYEVVRSQLDEVIDQSQQLQELFDLQSTVGGPITFDLSDSKLNPVYQQIVQVLQKKNYDTTIFFPPNAPQQAFAAAQEQLKNIPKLIGQYKTARQQTEEAEGEWSFFHSDRDKVVSEKKSQEDQAQENAQDAIQMAVKNANSYFAAINHHPPAEFFQLQSISASLPTQADQASSTALVAGAALATATPSTSSITALSKYAVPYIGQVQAAVDSLTSLGQSVAQFVSLFRQNEVVNGVPLSIPTEALNALVIAHLKQLESDGKQMTSPKFHIRCFMPDYLPDNVAEEGQSSGVNQSGILQQVAQLTELTNKISRDLARFNSATGQILPSLAENQPDIDEDGKLRVLKALLQFAQRLEPVKDPKDLDTQNEEIQKAFAADFQPMQTQLKTYQTSMNQLLASLYGGSGATAPPNSAAPPPPTNQPSATPPATPTPAGTGTNSFLISSVVSPTVSPTINPVITVNASFSTNSATASTNSPSAIAPSAVQGGGASASPPLAAILQQEALFEKLSRMPLLYLNVLSAGGANMTANGWFTSSFKYNAGVAVDFFLTDTNGEVLASSLENDQSPYLKEVGSRGGERLPTVVTTDLHATTQTDIDDLEDTEPESRFTTVQVKERPATGRTIVTPDYSRSSSKPRSN